MTDFMRKNILKKIHWKKHRNTKFSKVRDTTIHLTEIKRIIGKNYEYFYANKLVKLDKMGIFFKRHTFPKPTRRNREFE